MSPTFQHLEQPSETTYLQERVNRLRASMEWARDAIPPEVRDSVSETIQRCDERLALGVDHTVVALAGGTGSGKSSLFNAIVGMDFAIPGVARPTTSHVSAATWGDEADALLDWLEVAPDRRLRRESELDAEDQADLRGTVLLDLPDHDSINADNRAVVDRVIPMADLLLWVVDPQKYADHALHSAYLKAASEHGHPSLVVLNHVDRLSTEDAWTVARDLQRLLSEGGMDEVPVMPVSAKTGQGLTILREELAGAAHARSVAAEAVRAELISAGSSLAGALAKDAEPTVPSVDFLVNSLAKAAGVDARAEAAAAVVAGKGHEVPAGASAQLALVERDRLDWVDLATEGLPKTWRKVVDDAVVNAQTLTDDINAALGDVEWPATNRIQGWRSFVARGATAKGVAKKTLAAGRDAVRGVVAYGVVEPTEMIHQAYRALDELTELD